jgi:hypothetical protein
VLFARHITRAAFGVSLAELPANGSATLTNGARRSATKALLQLETCDKERVAIDGGIHLVSSRTHQRARCQIVHVLALSDPEDAVVVLRLDRRRLVHSSGR